MSELQDDIALVTQEWMDTIADLAEEFGFAPDKAAINGMIQTALQKLLAGDTMGYEQDVAQFDTLYGHDQFRLKAGM